MSTTTTVVSTQIEEDKRNKGRAGFFPMSPITTRPGNPWPTPPTGTELRYKYEDKNTKGTGFCVII